MDNMETSGSTINSDDAFHIEQIVKDWIDEGKENPEFNTRNQDKVKGAITILKQFDNVTLDIKSKSHNITDLKIKTIPTQERIK